MVSFYGDYDTTETVAIPFNTFSSDDPAASVTITNLLNTDVHIHKDGGVTQRTSANGVTVSTDFDSVTGNHMVTIDLSDNSDAGFYATGSRYQVRVEGTTVDGATINAWIGAFSIGCTLRPTTAGRTLDVTAGGAAGIDWANVEGQGTSVNLSGTTTNLVNTTTTNTDMRGTDAAATATALATVDTEVGQIKAVTDLLPDAGALTSIAQGSDLATVSTNVDAILVDTGTTLPAQISGLNDLSAAQVNAEVVDALATDTYAEPGQGTPAATTTLAAKINYLYKALRNRSTQTASQYSLYDAAGTTVDHKATVSDDGTTTDRGTLATGP